MEVSICGMISFSHVSSQLKRVSYSSLCTPINISAVWLTLFKKQDISAACVVGDVVANEAPTTSPAAPIEATVHRQTEKQKL
jgi:hypothetical protein